ncbi:MAG TPA: hypothetical protein VKE96_14025 [Vicinamibacterales bacterium]|nr:hypothetical protein [Vicinamibacterales bacterium]
MLNRLSRSNPPGRLVELLACISQRWWLAASLVAAAYGVRTTDLDEFRKLSAAPFVMNLAPQYQFLYGSPLTFFLGSYYRHHGIDELTAFFLVHGLGVVLFFVALRAALHRVYREEDRSLAAIVMLSSPLLLVVLFWFGKADPYLLAAFFLLKTTDAPFTRVILSAIMVAAHRELAAAVLLADLCLDARPWRAVALGVALGESALFVYTNFMLSSAPASRGAYAAGNAVGLWQIFRAHPLLHLIATFGPFWIYVLTRRSFRLSQAGVFAAALVLAAGTYDFTRVFTIVSIPVVFGITRDAVEDINRTGGIMVARRRFPAEALWVLMLIQVHLVGTKLLWAHGLDLTVGL